MSKIARESNDQWRGKSAFQYLVGFLNNGAYGIDEAAARPVEIRIFKGRLLQKLRVAGGGFKYSAGPATIHLVSE